jgi:hypothetical protein
VNQFTLPDGNSLHAHPDAGVLLGRREGAMVERDLRERQDRVALLWLSAVTIILIFAFILTTP